MEKIKERPSIIPRRTGRTKATASQPNHTPDLRLEVLAARYVRPGRMFLQFADGLSGSWTFRQLGLQMSNMKSATLNASAAGDGVDVLSKNGESVQLDASSLRVMIDGGYAKEITNHLDLLQRIAGL